jgi:hypothetical protein
MTCYTRGATNQYWANVTLVETATLCLIRAEDRKLQRFALKPKPRNFVKVLQSKTFTKFLAVKTVLGDKASQNSFEI